MVILFVLSYTFPCILAYFKSLKSLTGEYIFGILLNKLVKLTFSFMYDDKSGFIEAIHYYVDYYGCAFRAFCGTDVHTG